MRLIDADKLLTKEHQYYNYLADELFVPVRDIEDAPTADVIEVKRAEWLHEQVALPLSDGSKECVRCSYCLTHWDNESNFCPYCGADMREENKRMTKFMPHPQINAILRKRSAELRKHRCYSTWYFDDENNTIVICTTLPGYWIGKAGADIDNLKNEINELLTKRKLNPISIEFIECES